MQVDLDARPARPHPFVEVGSDLGRLGQVLVVIGVVARLRKGQLRWRGRRRHRRVVFARRLAKLLVVIVAIGQNAVSFDKKKIIEHLAKKKKRVRNPKKSLSTSQLFRYVHGENVFVEADISLSVAIVYRYCRWHLH